MPFQHTKTELTVLAREQAKASASIEIGMQLMAGRTLSELEDIDDRYQKRKAECEEDALAIYSLLHGHLPEETITKLTSLFRNLNPTIAE